MLKNVKKVLIIFIFIFHLNGTKSIWQNFDIALIKSIYPKLNEKQIMNKLNENKYLKNQKKQYKQYKQYKQNKQNKQNKKYKKYKQNKKIIKLNKFILKKNKNIKNITNINLNKKSQSINTINFNITKINKLNLFIKNKNKINKEIKKYLKSLNINTKNKESINKKYIINKDNIIKEENEEEEEEREKEEDNEKNNRENIIEDNEDNKDKKNDPIIENEYEEILKKIKLLRSLKKLENDNIIKLKNIDFKLVCKSDEALKNKISEVWILLSKLNNCENSIKIYYKINYDKYFCILIDYYPDNLNSLISFNNEIINKDNKYLLIYYMKELYNTLLCYHKNNLYGFKINKGSINVNNNYNKIMFEYPIINIENNNNSDSLDLIKTKNDKNKSIFDGFENDSDDKDEILKKLLLKEEKNDNKKKKDIKNLLSIFYSIKHKKDLELNSILSLINSENYIDKVIYDIYEII